MADDDAVVTTEVIIPVESEETPAVDEGDTIVTVVTEPADDGGSLPVVVDHEGRLTLIEQTQAEILQILQTQQAQVAVAQESASAALDVALTPEPEPEPEPDNPPAKRHFMHKSLSELLGRS